MKLMEIDLVGKAQEVERLRAEVLNAERRAQGNKFVLVSNPILSLSYVLTYKLQVLLSMQQSTHMLSLTCTQLLQYMLAWRIWMAMEGLIHKWAFTLQEALLELPLLEEQPSLQILPGDDDHIKLHMLGSK